jgi:hypothetical protein
MMSLRIWKSALRGKSIKAIPRTCWQKPRYNLSHLWAVDCIQGFAFFAWGTESMILRQRHMDSH